MPKSHLDQSLDVFAGELLSFVQRASDSIYALKRTVEQRPSAGVQDFKECLDDLEQQVSDFTDEIQQLVGCTSDTTSLEELIGHCTAVYNSNRTATLALEQHLSQYGYQRPEETVQEPENPEKLMQDAGLYDSLDAPLGSTGSGAALARLSCRTAAGTLAAGGAQQRQSYSTPTSPVSKSSLGVFKPMHMPSRLGKSQPGSPQASYMGAPAATDPWEAAVGAAPATVRPARGAGNAGAGTVGPSTQYKQQERTSFGTTSSTPPGLLISPGVAALANKYATSSTGGSSLGGLSLTDCQPSTGTGMKRNACRDLSLSYSAADVNSPDLPIFGHTANNSQQQGSFEAAAHQGVAENLEQQQQQWTCATFEAADASPAAADQMTPQAAARKAAAGNDGDGDDDTTGQLYSSLIHSNMQGLTSRDIDMEGDQAGEPVTPLAMSRPTTPATAGRLPAEWHSKKMQELEDLQANLTITLSQMKRTPSRSRTANLTAAEAAGDDSEEEQQQMESKQGEQQQQRWQQGPSEHSVEVSEEGEELDARQDMGAAAVEHQQQPMSRNLQRLRQRLQQQRQHQQQQQQQEYTAAPVGAAAADAAAGDVSNHSSSSASSAGLRSAAAVATAAAAAAAATADLESWMESLSKKYAAEQAEPAAAIEASAGSPAAITAAPASRQEYPLLLQNDHQLCSTVHPDVNTTTSNAEDSDSLSIKYAALVVDAAATKSAAQQQAPEEHEEEDTGLPLPAPSSSPKQQQQQRRIETAELMRSSAAASAAVAAAVRSSAVMCSVASDVSGFSDGTPGKPRLAAAMAAFYNALRMDAPSPLSPGSPAGRLRSSQVLDNSEATAAGTAVPNTADTGAPPAAAAGQEVEATADTAVAEDAGTDELEATVELAAAAAACATADAEGDASMSVENQTHQQPLPPPLQQQPPQSVLTPETQQAIRCAVAAVGLDSARPKSSIRHPQPTTDLKRLQEMRGYWHGLQHQQGVGVGQQHPQQQRGLVQNLDARLAGAEDDAGAAQQAAGLRVKKHPEVLAKHGASSPSSQQQNDKQQSTPSRISASSCSTSGSNSTRQGKPAGLDAQLQQRQHQHKEQQLTPRAARAARRQQLQEQQQHQGRKAPGPGGSSGVLRAVENTAHSSPAGSAAKNSPAAARGSPAGSAGSGSAKKDFRTSSAVLVKAKPVTEEEFSGLPGWCRGLLTVDVLNSALEELQQLAAGRAGKRGGVAVEGFTAADLELLGHSSSKSKTIVSCLHKLSRATLQRSAAGCNVYKLVGTPAN